MVKVGGGGGVKAEIGCLTQLTYEQEQLDRADFVEWLTSSIKAEFILGKIVHSPAREGHLLATGTMAALIKTFVSKHKLGKVRIEKALVRIGHNDFEPDINFWIEEKCKDWDKEDMFYPAPDFIVEVLPTSTKSLDRGIKYDSHQNHAVAEYWIVDHRKETVEQYENSLQPDGKYGFKLKQTFGVNDTVSCIVLEGLSFSVAVIFNEDLCFSEQEKIIREN